MAMTTKKVYINSNLYRLYIKYKGRWYYKGVWSLWKKYYKSEKVITGKPKEGNQFIKAMYEKPKSQASEIQEQPKSFIDILY
jgi:hypothetical protein